MKRKAQKKYFWKDLKVPNLGPELEEHAKKVARSNSLAKKITQTTDPEEQVTSFVLWVNTLPEKNINNLELM